MNTHDVVLGITTNQQEETQMTTAIYTVQGMTCSHCVASVAAEVSAIDGVADVEVDLSTGAVQVTSDSELDVREVRAAVEEAGYVLSE